jgi:hypothetical protein
MSRSGIVVAAVVVFALGLVALRWLDAGGERVRRGEAADGGAGDRYAGRFGASGDQQFPLGDDGRRDYGRPGSESSGDRRSRIGFRDATGSEHRTGSQSIVEGRRGLRDGPARSSLGGGEGGVDRRASRTLAGSDRSVGSDRLGGLSGDAAPRLDRLREYAPAPGDAESAWDEDLLPKVDEEEDGKLFDPLAPEVQNAEIDRGRDEDPAAVHNVDFLEDEGGVYAGEDSVLSFPATGNVDGGEGTINLVIEPDWDGADTGKNNLLRVGEKHIWENRMLISKDNQALRMQHFDSLGIERGLLVRIDDWVAGERHQITVTYGPDRLEIYVDGELADTQPAEGATIDFSPKATIEVGSAENDALRGANSRIYDLATFNSMKLPGEF